MSFVRITKVMDLIHGHSDLTVQGRGKDRCFEVHVSLHLAGITAFATDQGHKYRVTALYDIVRRPYDVVQCSYPVLM